MSRRSEEQNQARSRGRPKGLPKRNGEVSQEVRVAPPELERWRRVCPDGSQQGPEGEEKKGSSAAGQPDV